MIEGLGQHEENGQVLKVATGLFVLQDQVLKREDESMHRTTPCNQEPGKED